MKNSANTTVDSVRLPTLKNFKMQIPNSPSEQEKVAKLLTKIDILINEKEKEIQQLNNIINVIFNNLFSSNVECNFKLKDICVITSGKRLPKGSELTKNKQHNKYLRVTNMNPFGIKENEDILYVPNEIAKSIENYKIFKDELFISVAGTIGIVGILPDSLDGINLTENANRISHISCNSNYLLYLLNSKKCQSYFTNNSTISSQPKLALNIIRNAPIFIPTFEEQSNVVNVIDNVFEILTINERQLEKILKIRQYLINKILV